MHGGSMVVSELMAEPLTESDQPSDLALLQRFHQGEKAALEQLCLRHMDTAYRVALRFTGNAQDAEDAVQSAFLHLLTRDSNFRVQEQSSVKGWMMAIVINACREQARSVLRRRNR